MVAVIDRVGETVDAIDVFCGFGGSSQGIHAAGATVLAAANHNAISLECHATNFPDTEHWQADLVDAADPKVINRAGKKVAGMYLDPADLPAARFAWFSPACTHHSQANAKKIYSRGHQAAIDDDDEWDEQAYVNSERSRVTMSCVLRYAAARHPEIIAVENVVEVTKWGPNRDGSTFEWWCRELEKEGYVIQHLYFNSMFFPPCPQSRDRWYCVASRRGSTMPDLDYRPRAYCMSDRCGGRHVEAVQSFKRPTKAWPMPKWGKYRSQYVYRCPDCYEQVDPASWIALSAMDLDHLGPTIGERRAAGRPLAPKTLERTRRAWAKFWYAPPVALPAGSGLPSIVHTAHPLDPGRFRHGGEHLGTLSRKNDQGLAMVVPNRTHNLARHAGQATAPVMTSATQAMVVTAAGNTAERPGQTRARHSTSPLFTQSATAESAVVFSPTLRGDHDQQTHAGQPLTTVSAAGTHHPLVTALFQKQNGGPESTAPHTLFDPLSTITGRDTTGLMLMPWAGELRLNPSAITDDVAVLTAQLRRSLDSAIPYDGIITDEMLDQVHFRMLKPDPELRRATAFADSFILIGTNEQMTAGLGNAVTPPVALFITTRCLATLGGGSTNNERMAA